jgi:ATP synthase protein I
MLQSNKGKDMADKPVFRQLLEASMIGINLVISTFIGLAMGYGLDYAMGRWIGWHTKPWLTIVFLFIGIIAGFKDLYLMAKKPDDQSHKKNS